MSRPKDDRDRSPNDSPPNPSLAGCCHLPWSSCIAPVKSHARYVPPENSITRDDPEGYLGVTGEDKKEGHDEMMNVEGE